MRWVGRGIGWSGCSSCDLSEGGLYIGLYILKCRRLLYGSNPECMCCSLAFA